MGMTNSRKYFRATVLGNEALYMGGGILFYATRIF
jgi:hypothetical protein